MTPYTSPRLLADIGGSYARFAIEPAPGVLRHTLSLRCAEHADFHAAVGAYLDALPADQVGRVEHAAIAIANPVEGDRVRMTNYHWQFSIEQMRQRLDLATLVVVNDFTALAMALPRLAPHERRQVGGGAPRERSVIGLLGAGSGLGVSGLIPAGEGWIALGTEGGHAAFAPRDERELAILQHASRIHPHVSFERLLSGPGLELVHRALAERAGLAAEPLAAPEITRRALAGRDALCTEVLDAFCAMLGTAAGNLAVTLGAFGGIYIGGGIVPRLGAYFDRSPFRARFEDKGRFAGYVRAIPTYVVTAGQATLAGASAILAEQLRLRERSSGPAILGQVQRERDKLSPAERRVADHVLAHPRSALAEPIAAIARAAGVSQPTVIRFCRTLGCEGLSDFKLRLASGLSGTVPITHTQVTGADSSLELGAKVLSNTASAILELRERLKAGPLARAIELLAAANRVEFYALGQGRVLADDAQFKFLRLGVPSSSVTDPRLQPLAARVLRPGDVAVVISSSGATGALLEVADAARARGVPVLAITASRSLLAKKADAAVLVDHAEDLTTQVPMVSRILHLLVIDILAVGVAVARGQDAASAEAAARAALAAAATQAAPPAPDETPSEAEGGTVQRAGPGISMAGVLARLTSHSR